MPRVFAEALRQSCEENPKIRPPRQGLAGSDPLVERTFGLIEAHPDRDARPFALLSSCLAEIAAKVVSSDPSELPKAATPMV